MRDFEDDHYRLQATYDIVAQENDDLRAEIGRLRLASQSSQTSLSQLPEEEEGGGEERRIARRKGKMRETGEEATEVRKIISLIVFYADFLIFFTFQPDESDEAARVRLESYFL